MALQGIFLAVFIKTKKLRGGGKNENLELADDLT
jgi:hypothetical protein